ncbi:MAG: PorP/SprF family type IX secretion system membrane protein [Bacteroidota bacterium]
MIGQQKLTQNLLKTMRLFNKKYSIAFIIVILMSFKGFAQEPNFSMYHYTPFFTNPGSIGVVEDVRLMFNYRNQSIEAGDNFTTATISAFYPINVGNDRLVIAGNFLNDRASDLLSTNGGLLALAYSVSLSESSSLSLGFQGGYFQRQIDSDFTTDDQFVDGVFDPDVVSGDAVLNRSANYATLSGGLHYQVQDEYGREKAFIGGSIFNFTQPDIALADGVEDDLPLSYRASAGYRVYQGTKVSVLPTLRWVNQEGNNFLNLGSRFGYELSGGTQNQKRIELGLWYNTNDLGVVSIAYEQDNFVIGTSYDVPVGSDLSTGQNGIFELAVSFRLKKKKERNKKSPVTQEPIATDQIAPVEEEKEEVKEEEEIIEEKVERPADDNTEPQEEVETPIQENVSTASVLTEQEKELLSKTVMFDFNTNELNTDSKQFLDQVSDILISKPDLKVELIGHSCDIGPESVNAKLSEARARRVQDYLSAKGITDDRFVIEGMGETRPMRSNDTPEGREDNRRVEFRVIE